MNTDILNPRVMLLALSASLTACGGGGGGGGGGSPPPPPAPNNPPTANAPAPQSAISGDFVSLSGSGTDPNGDSLSFSWRSTSHPDLMILGASTANARFIAPYGDDGKTESVEFELQVSDGRGGSDIAPTQVNVTTGINGCDPGPVPTELGLMPYHAKYCDVYGIPHTGPSNLADRALENVAIETRIAFSSRPDIVEEAARNGLRVVVKDQNDVLTDIPELADLYDRFPGIDFDILPGIGAVMAQPYSVTTEENALCRGLQGDNYSGFSVHIHEIVHSMENMGLEFVDQTWNTRKENIFNQAMIDGLWQGTYSATNSEEYIAEGGNAWMDSLFTKFKDNLHNHVTTREDLLDYDPALYDLMAEFLAEKHAWQCR